MKASVFLLALACGVVIFAPRFVFAGLNGEPAVVPEPTALLVWAGLAGVGGLFFWRRNRDAD